MPALIPAILKGILFLILLLLGLLLLILLLLLFVPFCYRGHGKRVEEQLSGALRVSWLFSLLRKRRCRESIGIRGEAGVQSAARK